MIGLIDTHPFLRITLLVAMETMHFLHNPNRFRTICFALRETNEQFGTHEKLSLGCKVGRLRCLGVSPIDS